MELSNLTPKYNNNFTLKVISSGEYVKTINCKNLVTNKGQTAYIDGGIPSYIALGVGAHTESPTITALEKFSVKTNGRWEEVGSLTVDTEKNTVTRVFRMVVVLPVEKENKLYSEIGLVNDKNEAFAYARLRDSSGAPTTITVLKNEQLEVTYTFSVSLLYKHTDESTGYTCYLHNIPAPHESRGATWTSGADKDRFLLFEDSIDRLDAGLPPSIFSGSRNNGRYVKRNNKISAEVVTAIGQEGRVYTGVHSGYSNSSDFRFSIVFPEPMAINKDAYYSFSFTIPYLKD